MLGTKSLGSHEVAGFVGRIARHGQYVAVLRVENHNCASRRTDGLIGLVDVHVAARSDPSFA